jgi:hypothetical protein
MPVVVEAVDQVLAALVDLAAVVLVQRVVHINLHSVLIPIKRKQVLQTLAEVEEEHHTVALEAVLLVEAV